MGKPELTIILGPTGVGKTDYAINLALEYASPVISCDSRQIFKEMKIGTAPPSPQQLERVKHYFIFSHSVTDYYTAGRYEIEALELLAELFKTHKRLVMAGGSGLYIDALCNGLDDFPPADQDLRERLSRQAETALRKSMDRTQIPLEGPNLRMKLVRPALPLPELRISSWVRVLSMG